MQGSVCVCCIRIYLGAITIFVQVFRLSSTAISLDIYSDYLLVFCSFRWWGLSHDQLFFYDCYCCCLVAKLCLTLWDPMEAHQASLSLIISRSLPKFMSIESVMPSNCLSSSVMLFSFCLQSSPGSFPMSQLSTSGGQSFGASASMMTVSMTAHWKSSLVAELL